PIWPPRHRHQRPSRPTPLEDRTHHSLAHRLPPPHHPLRTARPPIRRIPIPRRRNHLLQETRHVRHALSPAGVLTKAIGRRMLQPMTLVVMFCSPVRRCILKRGLVLEGGGAKGAYQVGCMRAFQEHDIKFDAIAGTSIGALNGALLSS